MAERSFVFDDEITFSKAVYYNFHPIPLPRVFKDATGGYGRFAPLQGWIQLYDSEGYCGETFCSSGMVTNILPLILTGERRSYTEWYDYLYWRLRNFGFQSGEIVDLGQLDLLMLELLARRAEKPLHRFLGARKDWAAAYKGGGGVLLEDEELVADMVRFVDEGYTTVKFKVGSDLGTNIERDLRRMKLVRRAVGEEIRIAVDANQVWGVEEALEFAEAVRPFNPAWFEEPVHSHDMNAIARLRAALNERGIELQIGFGESMRNYYAFESYVEKGVDHLMPLVGRMSRMDDLLSIRRLAHDHGLAFSSGGTVQLNAAFGALYDEDEPVEFHEPIVQTIGDYLSVKPTPRNGRLHLPDIVGSPIRLDLARLEREGYLESVRYLYAEREGRQFSVRSAY